MTWFRAPSRQILPAVREELVAATFSSSDTLGSIVRQSPRTTPLGAPWAPRRRGWD